MSLKATIEADIKKAMLAKEKDKLRALRSIKSLILLAETEKGAVEELSEEKELALLMKAAKQRRDSIAIYQEQNRPDLTEGEQQELDVIELYLPKMMSEEELKVELEQLIQKVGASGPSDMGKVMGLAMKELNGKAEGSAISAMVKSLLNS